MKKYIYSFITITLFFIGSCDRYLDQVPDNRAMIDNAEAIKELLVSAYPKASYLPFCEQMSDNADDKGIRRGQGSRKDIDAYEWNEFQEISQDTPTYYWNACYSAIAAANQAIASIKEIGEGHPEMKPILGEALICRAYAGYMLTTIFCNSYHPETAAKEMGVPYPKEPGRVVFGHFTRGTLKETFQNIREDLENGLPLIENDYRVPRYHFTKEASAAFASRFYLILGEWDQVIEHADKALGNRPAIILRGWNNPETYVVYTYDELKATYSASSEESNILLISCASWWGRNFANTRFGLTTAVQDSILRTKNPLALQYAFRVFGTDVVRNVPKMKEYFKYNSLNATTGVGYTMISVFTAEEVLFNRAEAHLMKGDYSKALEDLNIWLSKRLKNYTGSDLQTLTEEKILQYYSPGSDRIQEFHTFYPVEGNQRPYLQCILDMRRSEFVHEGIRWFDIKRIGLPVTHIRKSGSNDEESTLTLSWNDPRKAVQIPQDAQTFGIEANPR